MGNRKWYPMVRGIVYAAALLVRTHDQGVYAKDILNLSNIDRKVATKARCDTYDMEALEEVWSELERKSRK